MIKIDDQAWVCAANDPRISPSRRRAKVLRPDHAPAAAELLASYSAIEIQELALALPPDYRAANAIWPLFCGSDDLEALERFVRHGEENPHIGAVASYVAAAAQYSVTRSFLEIERRQLQTLELLSRVDLRIRTARDRKAPALVEAFLRGRDEPATADDGKR